MEGVILSWQAWLIANTARKQTQNSFNHASWQRISLGAGTRHAIKGPIQTQSETLGDPKHSLGKQPIHEWFSDITHCERSECHT